MAGVSWPTRVVAPVALIAAAILSMQPVRPLGAAAVAVLLGVAGHGLVGASSGRLPWAARGGVAVGAGFLLAAVPLLGLADAGWFGPVGVGLVGLLLAGAAVVGGGRGGGRARRVGAVPVVLLALAGAGAASLPAYAFDLGGRDAGFYVMTSEHLQEEGGLVLPLDADAREATARFAPRVVGADEERPLPGFFVRGSDRGGTTSIVPHGYHLTPAVMAGGATVTGGAGQWVVTLLGGVLVLLAAGVAALLVRPGLRVVATVAGGLLLATDAALIYFSRYPMTEVPSGVLLLTAGVAAAAALRGADLRGQAGSGNDRDGALGEPAGAATRIRTAVLAGAALGAAPLARPDAWPLLVVAPVVALLLARTDRRAARGFAAGLVLLVAIAALRALTASEAYTEETIGYVLGGISPTAIVIALAALSTATSVAASLLPSAKLSRALGAAGAAADRRTPRRVAAGVVLLGTAVLVVHPPALGLEIFREYATRPGVLLAGLGLAAVVLAGPDERRRLVPLAPLLVLAAVALGLVARDPQVLVPDQYWTARRYLPVALPVAAALAGVAVATAWGLRGRGRVGIVAVVAAPLLVLVGVAGSLSDARQALTVTEFDGVPQRIEQIDALLTGEDPLVLMGPGYTAWGMVGPALALRQDRQTLMLSSAQDPSKQRTATLDDPDFSRWLGRVARRRPVYLVTANLPPIGIASNADDVRPVSVGSVSLPITQIDHRVGGPPTGHSTTTDLIGVFRLEPGVGR